MSKFRGGKWRSDGPTRTNTGSSIRGKISAPIPIQDDDEFPIRTPGAGIAMPLGSEAIESRLRASIAAELDDTALHTVIPISNTVDPKAPVQGPAQQSREVPIRRTNQPSTQRDSGASVPSGSSIGKPQRKKSSFRSAIGRLFGKKSKNGGASPPGQDVSGIRAGQHRSDPTALNRSPTSGAGSQKRSASLPINEYNRALRSHSTAIEDFPNTGDDETNLESINADVQRRSRRATTPSRLWTPTKAPGYGDWTGLSPRPASSHARGSSVNPDAEVETAAGIGVAVTSDNRPKRRSRSLGEMREAAGIHPVARRRSDEIRYWRESYEPGILSPMSSNKAEAEEPVVMDEPEESRQKEPQEQPQPFNFGALGEMAGMKITQAASLDTRVRRLEERMLKTERALFSLQNRTFADQLPNRSSSTPRPTSDNSQVSLPKRQRHHEPPRQQTQESRPQGSQKRSSSYGSSRPSTVSTHISHHPSFDNYSHPTVPSSDPPLSSSQSTTRPLSTSTTIRGAPSSSPTLPKDGNFTADHYTALANMILAERAARQQLEAVVHHLQQQLHALRSTASRPARSSNHPAHSQRAGSAAAGEFSSFEQDDSSDDEGRYLQEDFQTPNEPGGHFGDEIFGGVDHGETKVAPRTLSLSQITLGKGANQILNF